MSLQFFKIGVAACAKAKIQDRGNPSGCKKPIPGGLNDPRLVLLFYGTDTSVKVVIIIPWAAEDIKAFFFQKRPRPQQLL